MLTSWKRSRRVWLVLGLGLCLGLAGCSTDVLPQRNGIFKTWSEAVRSYQDYLHLERAGVETLNLKMGDTILTVSLPFYLFTIAQEFERFGKRPQAVQLYMRLLMNYPMLDEENQLGVRIENRLHWLLSDKSWVQPSAETLLLSLQDALKLRDAKALQRLISRDFGFGEDPNERIAVNYQWAVQYMQAQWNGPKPLAFSVQPQEDGKIWLQVQGWAGDHPVWIFVLHERTKAPAGWEWDTVLWPQ